ncbi:MAG: tRNA 2-thiouridine(34) synthase MnmA [Gemmatimonadetes bacterium]|nr:tRNA 2-thiouridine(34) synthase MnmA [Gemmatimonadota bacterium]MDA1104084.1 tRNA 2-thiouridine(34) synthase MnmA [Gemmatimonadota bacterium]
MSRVLVAMSGGVDSSVAAALLVDAGHDVVGVTMKTFCYSDTSGHGKTCCGLDGISDAKRVAAALGILHYVFDVEEDFTRDVIDDFVSEYARGRTPNPCVRCNSNTKFPDLLARGKALECDRIATGHYVRVEHTETGSFLSRGTDTSKDQSYFLWGLPPSILPQLLFPLGELNKPEVRSRARALELATADKPESQEICFVPSGDYRDLLKRRLGPIHPALEAGPLVRRDGRIVGEHSGFAGFTVGQRKGLGGGFSEPMFVLEIRPDTREVVVGTQEETFLDRVVVADLNWLTDAPAPESSVRVQLRYRSPAVEATVTAAGGRLTLQLAEPQAAVTPGQSAVVFDGDRVLGGGRIESAGSLAPTSGVPSPPSA